MPAKHIARRGRHNFDRIRLDYYRDTTVLREALKSGRIDYRQENQAKAWATAYEIPALKAKKLIKLLVPTESGAGMQAFAINSRKAKFSDPRVRRALGYAFDFNYTNRTLFFGQYKRTKSYFENSELASSGIRRPLPVSATQTTPASPHATSSGEASRPIGLPAARISVPASGSAPSPVIVTIRRRAVPRWRMRETTSWPI